VSQTSAFTADWNSSNTNLSARFFEARQFIELFFAECGIVRRREKE